MTSLTAAGSFGHMTARSSDRDRKHMDRNRPQPARYEPAPAPQTAKCPCGRPRPRPQCGHPQPARATAHIEVITETFYGDGSDFLVSWQSDARVMAG